jgi:chemosensory pili system protein ChpA (sensor histidine kinase/response regulator)
VDTGERSQLSDQSSSSGAALQEEASIGPSILLIDDSLSIRKFVARMLENAGYAVDTAVDGEDGLRKAAANRYRLVITDLEMPKLNGYEVIQALRGRAQSQTLPIVVMTTRAGDKHRQLALNIGASGYIAKPVEERALIAEVERWLQLPSSMRT